MFDDAVDPVFVLEFGLGMIDLVQQVGVGAAYAPGQLFLAAAYRSVFHPTCFTPHFR
jgi:hypothetical protein